MARPLDPYRTLELPRDATLDEVKAAYRRLAKLYHPDSAGERAVPRFLAVQAAYEALTEGPGKLRSVIGGRSRPASASPGRASSGRGRGPAADPWTSRAGASGPRATRGAGAGTAPGASGSRPGTRAGQGAAGAAGSSSASASASGDGAASGRGGSSRTRGPAGPRPRRTRRAPGSTSYDGADAEPFEPEWQGASWYGGGSSGTYWTLNPREFADPRKHGPEYLARGADNGRGTRSRRARATEGKAGRPTTDSASRSTGLDEERGAAGPTPFDDLTDDADDAYGRPTTYGPEPWSARRRSEVSAFGLISMALLAVGVVAVLFAVMADASTPGAVSVVPVVAFSGIAIVALVRVLRRDGRPRA